MRISLLHPSMEAAELPITGNAPHRAQVWGDGVSLPHPKSPPWAGVGQPGAPLAMHLLCLATEAFGCIMSCQGVTLAAFCSLIKHSSNRGGMVKEKVDGGSRRGRYACDKQVNGNLCADS